jgi:phytanoyl-CoA hydroxylase
MGVEVNAAARNLEDQGFAVLPGLLPETELADLSGQIDQIISGVADYLPPKAVIYEPGTSPPRVRNAFHIHQYNPYYLKVASHPEIVRLIGGILGYPLRLYSSSLFAKPPEVGGPVPLHQDMAYWPFKPYELLSCWIALDDSTIENGCVSYLVGSHKLGLLRHVPSGVTGNSLGLQDARAENLEARSVEVTRGSCVLHHCLTAHWSGPNRSLRPRRGLIFIYMSPRVELTDPSQINVSSDFPVVATEES